jgi:peptidoglycan hydrolase CwlO-like protein
MVERRRIAIFFSITIVVFAVSFGSSLLLHTIYNYDLLLVFSIIATSEGVVLGIYQSIFVNRVVNRKFVTGQEENLRRALRLITEYHEEAGKDIEQLHNELEQVVQDINDTTGEIEEIGLTDEEIESMTEIEEFVENKKDESKRN